MIGKTICLSVQITRIWDLDWYPGLAECVLVDALGVEHRFQDKIPVFSARELTPADTPCEGAVRCVREGENPDGTLTVNTKSPTISNRQPGGTFSVSIPVSWPMERLFHE